MFDEFFGITCKVQDFVGPHQSFVQAKAPEQTCEQQRKNRVDELLAATEAIHEQWKQHVELHLKESSIRSV